MRLYSASLWNVVLVNHQKETLYGTNMKEIYNKALSIIGRFSLETYFKDEHAGRGSY